MVDKEEIIIDRANILKEKINMCFILLSNKLETIETIERTIYEHLDIFVRYWNAQLASKTQECEELKERLVRTEEDLKYQCVDCMNCQSDRYRKALDEIEKRCCAVLNGNERILYAYQIRDIINKAKDGE